MTQIMTVHLLSSLSAPRRFSAPLSRHTRPTHRRSRRGSIRVSAASSLPRPALSLSVDSIDLQRLKSVLPGGRWWRLEEEDDDQEQKDAVKKKNVGLSVVSALKRMWVLVAQDKWVVFLGFVSLLGAACSSQRYVYRIF